MSPTLPKKPVDLRDPIALWLAATVSFTEQLAVLAAGFLDWLTKHLKLDRPPRLPVWFLIEAGAIMRIEQLQRCDAGGLGREFPPAAELLENLFGLLLAGGAGEEERSKELVTRLVEGWRQNYSWWAPIELGIDIRIEREFDEDLLKVLAGYLWNHRRIALKEPNNDEG